MSRQPCLFWFVHARQANRTVCLAVAAFTELSARRQVTKRLGKGWTVTSINTIIWPHAWVMDLYWPDYRRAADGPKDAR